VKNMGQARHFLFGLILLIAGCAPAVISDISDSALKVRTGLGTKEADILAEARRGCGLYGKTPVSISWRCLDQYCFEKEWLFACQP